MNVKMLIADLSKHAMFHLLFIDVFKKASIIFEIEFYIN